jgi:hypothetical protein
MKSVILGVLSQHLSCIKSPTRLRVLVSIAVHIFIGSKIVRNLVLKLIRTKIKINYKIIDKIIKLRNIQIKTRDSRTNSTEKGDNITVETLTKLQLWCLRPLL